MKKARPGDVFCWSYKTINPNSTNPYWCKSCIGIVDAHLRLVDIYWVSGGSDGARWWWQKAIEELNLTYLGNLSDYQEVSGDPVDSYRAEDIFDLRHSNGGYAYVRKGPSPVQRCDLLV